MLWKSQAIVLPPIPPKANVKANIDTAESISVSEWYRLVKGGGKWDYKVEDVKWEAFGNFNYGATGAAQGFPIEILLRAAGAVSRLLTNECVVRAS